MEHRLSTGRIRTQSIVIFYKQSSPSSANIRKRHLSSHPQLIKSLHPPPPPPPPVITIDDHLSLALNDLKMILERAASNYHHFHRRCRRPQPPPRITHPHQTTPPPSARGRTRRSPTCPTPPPAPQDDGIVLDGLDGPTNVDIIQDQKGGDGPGADNDFVLGHAKFGLAFPEYPGNVMSPLPRILLALSLATSSVLAQTAGSFADGGQPQSAR
jgi:hypothetical protein